MVAAALTGARTLRAGQSEALSQAAAVATANGVTTGVEGWTGLFARGLMPLYELESPPICD